MSPHMVLMVLFCMVGTDKCEQVEKHLLAEVTPQQCLMVAAQQELPVMLHNNFTDPDNWRVRQYGCKRVHA